MVTPFLKTINTEGGTLYVFPSASKDLTRTLVSNDYEFKFSHFACLNLPNINIGTIYTSEKDKGLYLKTLDNRTINNTASDVGKNITEQFQNYIMNFETAILNGEGDDDNYDSDILTSVSEKVFFNWLQKIGGIKFDGNIEKYTDLAERTVQYIGNIDVINTVEVNGDSFEELYIHIPSTVGASQYVYFRSGEETDNKNYLDKEYRLSGDEYEYIIGRQPVTQTTSDVSPYGLSIDAIFDDDTINMYKGDEGHTIDFRDSSYLDGSGISTMNSEGSEDFEFNAVLIYYDFYEKTNISNVKKSSTNLYGILFLDNVFKTNGGLLYFQRYPKIKETVYGNGNSFAIKIDLKIDTTPDVTYDVISSYDDPNSIVSMSMYEKSLTQLQKCIDIFYKQENEIINLKSRINELESLVMGIDSMEDLRKEVAGLYDLYEGSVNLDNSSMLKLIEVNSKKIDTIINGGKNITLQYDTDVLQAGMGVSLDKSPNKVVITASQGYYVNKFYSDMYYNIEITDEYPLDPSNSTANCYLKWNNGENLAVLYIDDAGQYSTFINMYISTNEVEWNVGQTLKIYFNASGDDEILNLEDSYGINIYLNDIADPICEISNDKLKDVQSIDIIRVSSDKFIYLITR